MSVIHSRPTFDQEDWVIIVTTDHGGIGTDHGGTSIEEGNVYMIVSGNSVEQSLIEKECSNTFDETVNCLGDGSILLFDGDADRVEVNSNGLFDFGVRQGFSVECRVRTTESTDVSIVGNKG